MARPIASAKWKLVEAGSHGPPGAPSSSLPAAAAGAQAQSVEVASGLPYLLRPDGSVDEDVIRYCNSESFRGLALKSQLGYVYDLQSYLSFLGQRGVEWRHATGEDLVAYEWWRRGDPGNPTPISAVTFARDLTAIRRFYVWQNRQGTVKSLPMLNEWVRCPDGTIGPAGRSRPRTERSSKTMWLAPTQYRRWRDVGLLGHGTDNQRDSSWRGRNVRRNRAFADTLWSSGLRLSEASALLSWDVPAESPGKSFSRGHLALPAATGTDRDFWISGEALRAIEAYRTTERAAAVQRARRQGRYDDLEGITVVSPDRVSLKYLDVEERRRMFTEGDGGLEPASLWLTDAGTPVNQVSWEPVFHAANARCASAGLEVRCRPHMLRHSFAFRILAAWQLSRRIEPIEPIPGQRRAPRRLLLGDPFVLMQTLLGHGSPQATHRLYRDLDLDEHERIWQALSEEDDPDASLNDLLVQIAESREQGQGVPGSRSNQPRTAVLSLS